jgi:hypothetical protein
VAGVGGPDRDVRQFCTRSDGSPNSCRSRVIKRILTASSAGRHQRMNAEVVDASGEDSRDLGRTVTALEPPTQASACPGLAQYPSVILLL